MFEIKVKNCDNMEVIYSYPTKKDFLDRVESEDYCIPMLDDEVLTINGNCALLGTIVNDLI